MGSENLVAHYTNAYRTTDRLNVASWVREMSFAQATGDHAFLNPFDPTEKQYHQLLSWMPLADLDELLFGNAHVDAATCVAWWLCFTNWQAQRGLREEALWRRGMRKAYLQADFKALGLNPQQLLDVLAKEDWASTESLEYLKGRRSILWPEKPHASKWSSLRSRWLAWIQKRKQKKAAKTWDDELKKILVRGNTFEPRVFRENREI